MLEGYIEMPINGKYSEEEVQKIVRVALEKQIEVMECDLPPKKPLNHDPDFSGAQQFIQAAQGIENMKKYFRSPLAEAIENSMGTLITSSLEKSLQGMQGMQNQAQPQPEPKSLAKSLAEIAVHNMSQQVPQILQIVQEILGADRIKKGYDTGVDYFEKQNEIEHLPSIIAQLDPRDPEHVQYYAELMGISDFELAQNTLTDHVNSLTRTEAKEEPQPEQLF